MSAAMFTPSTRYWPLLCIRPQAKPQFLKRRIGMLGDLYAKCLVMGSKLRLAPCPSPRRCFPGHAPPTMGFIDVGSAHPKQRATV